jgi:hypothetical protein
MKARDLEIAPCGYAEVRAFIEQHHYSHNTNGVKVRQCFAVTHGGRLAGAVLFGALSTTAWKRFADAESKVLELRRLVLLDEAERNSESRVVGRCLRWVKQNLPEVEIVVSYADPAHGHSGTIYRASNFKYLGETAADKGFTDVETGKTYHSRALRTKDAKGKLKPFAQRLQEKQQKGLLEVTALPGKHCYVFPLKKFSPNHLTFNAESEMVMNTQEVLPQQPKTKYTMQPILDLLIRLVVALELIAAKHGNGAAPSNVIPFEVETPVEKPAPAPKAAKAKTPAAKEEAPKVDFEALRNECKSSITALVESGRKDAAKKVLAAHGVAKLAELADEKLPDIKADLAKLEEEDLS